MGSGGRNWRLEGFVEHLDAWVQREAPPEDLLFNPNSDEGSGTVVTCSYWIDERARTVRCNSIARLSWPG